MKSQEEFPLQLQGVMFTRSVVVAIQGHQPNNVVEDLLKPENSIDVKPAQDIPGRYIVSMRSSFNREMSADYPYMIDMECLVIFSKILDITEEEAVRAATITGHHVAYGAIRESVMWITSRQPYGPFLLGISVLASPKE